MTARRFEGDDEIKLRAVGLDRRIEVDLALFDLLHDGQGVEEFEIEPARKMLSRFALPKPAA